MPISDLYVVQFLLQATRAGSDAIRWEEKDSDGYVANINNIQLELDSVTGRTGSRLYLTFSYASERILIEEPHNSGVFREKYESDEQRCLAHRMAELARAVTRQCAVRNSRSAGAEQEIRETIYKRLITAPDGEV